MSIFFICSIACIARCPLDPVRICRCKRPESSGITCHDNPKRSFSQPHCRLVAAALEQAVPVVIHLGLVRARDEERNRLGEGELRAAVERHERLAVQAEGHRDHLPGHAVGATHAVRCFQISPSLKTER